jgi:hypothetical protein
MDPAASITADMRAKTLKRLDIMIRSQFRNDAVLTQLEASCFKATGKFGLNSVGLSVEPLRMARPQRLAAQNYAIASGNPAHGADTVLPQDTRLMDVPIYEPRVLARGCPCPDSRIKAVSRLFV